MTERRARALVRAKVNLWLAVRSRRADGYHEVETILQSIDIVDDITVVLGSSDHIEVVMEVADGDDAAPAADDNLAFRAALAYLDASQRTDGVRIEIGKNIPMSAGLGGGSADAAGVLSLLDGMFGDLSRPALQTLAIDLGSDVPFFLSGGTVLGTGRGEQLAPVDGAPRVSLVLGLSSRGLPTGDVYERWDLAPNSAPGDSGAMLEALARGSPDAIAAVIHNDLEAPAIALRPGLGRKKERMLEAGALGVCVSGSGPTLFGIARDGVHALEVAERLHDAFDRVVVTESASSSIERR